MSVFDLDDVFTRNGVYFPKGFFRVFYRPGDIFLEISNQVAVTEYRRVLFSVAIGKLLDALRTRAGVRRASSYLLDGLSFHSSA